MFEGYLKIDKSDSSWAHSWVVRSLYTDKYKFKDKSKIYVLVTIRDTVNEATLETDSWSKEWNQGRPVPNSLGEVWRNYFDYVKSTQHLRKQNGQLKLDAKERLVERGKTGRPKGEYGAYNILDRNNDPAWTTRIKCHKCGHFIRQNIYEARHGDKCTNKPRYIKIKDRPIQE